MSIGVTAIIYIPSGFLNVIPTLNSALVARKEAAKRHVRTQILIARPINMELADVLGTCDEKVDEHLFREDEDPANVKAAAVRKAEGRFIAWIEAGDLVSRNWFRAAHDLACRDARKKLILHPEATIAFGKNLKLFRNLDQESWDYVAGELPWRNLWLPSCFFPKGLLSIVPPTPKRDGFGHEDWHWNCETIAKGVVHKIVPRTVHFCRDESRHVREFFDRDWRVPVQDCALFGMISKNKLHDRQKISPPLCESRWFMKEWKSIPSIEPLLFPWTTKLPDFQDAVAMSREMSDLFVDFQRTFRERPDYLMIVHQLRMGGSELEALLHIKAIKKLNPTCKIGLIITETSESEWTSRLPDDVKVLHFGRRTAQFLDEESKNALLLRLLLRLSPAVIHVKHSRTAWTVLSHCGRAMSSCSSLYASLYCVDYAENGAAQSYAYVFLPHCMQYLTGIFCDNRKFANHLRSTLGFARTFVLPFPPSLPHQTPPEIRPKNGAPMSVLWASRIHRQKNVWALFDIAAAMPEVQFHVYGEFSFETHFPIRNSDEALFFSRLLQHKNVSYHGAFDGFGSIRVSDFDVFLYTAIWDGLPNVLLEAGASGLPIIAPDIGGVSELINENTGYIVRSPREYVMQLKAIRSNPGEARRRSLNLQRVLSRTRTFEAFTQTIRKVPRYLDKIEQR